MKLLYQDNHSYRFSLDYKKLDFQPHLHGAVELCYLLEGESLVQCGTQKYHLQAGDLFVAFPNQIHGYEHSKNVRCYLMILQVKNWLKPYNKILTEKLPDVPYLKKGSFEHTGIPELLAMAYADQKRVNKDVLQGYLAVIFGKILDLMPMQEARNDTLRDVLMFIHERYKEPLTRRDIARGTGYAESYISHLFCSAMRSSLPDYINALRIDDAKELLTTTDMSVGQIAESLGFGSIRNFGRAFQKHAGCAPKDYRKTAAK